MADAPADPGDIAQVGGERQPDLLQPDPLLELDGAHRGDRLEVAVEGGDAHAGRACHVLDPEGLPVGLPATYVDTGSAEVFRDEDIDYATRTWTAGGQAELHVWSGGFHGFDALYPQARISATARRTRTDWPARPLSTNSAVPERV